MRFKRFFVLHKFVFFALAFYFFVVVVTGQEFKQTALSEKKFTGIENDAGSPSPNINLTTPVSLSERDVLDVISCYRKMKPAESVERFKTEMPAPNTNQAFRQSIYDNLPATVKDLRITDPNLEEWTRKIARPVLELYGRQNIYDLIIIKHQTPVMFSDSGILIVLTTGIIERAASDDELLGYFAHEVGHEYFAQYSIYSKFLLKLVLNGGREQALNRKLAEMLAIVELYCDGFAALTLEYLNKNPLSFIEGMERIERDYPLNAAGFHPPDKVRRYTVESILSSPFRATKGKVSENLRIRTFSN